MPLFLSFLLEMFFLGVEVGQRSCIDTFIGCLMVLSGEGRARSLTVFCLYPHIIFHSKKVLFILWVSPRILSLIKIDIIGHFQIFFTDYLWRRYSGQRKKIKDIVVDDHFTELDNLSAEGTGCMSIEDIEAGPAYGMVAGADNYWGFLWSIIATETYLAAIEIFLKFVRQIVTHVYFNYWFRITKISSPCYENLK